MRARTPPPPTVAPQRSKTIPARGSRPFRSSRASTDRSSNATASAPTVHDLQDKLTDAEDAKRRADDETAEDVAPPDAGATDESDDQPDVRDDTEPLPEGLTDEDAAAPVEATDLTDVDESGDVVIADLSWECEVKYRRDRTDPSA